MDDKMKGIGERIQKARKEAGLSQEKLAEMLDISIPYLSDIENGKTNLGLKIFINITEVLQVSADWLLQTNTPTVNHIYHSEIHSMLSDFSPSELRSLSRIIEEIKTLIQ